MAINKVEYGGNTLIDITDTTATDNDVSNGQVYYRANGTRGVGTLVNPDVQVNGTSIVSNGVADIITEGTYNASTNKIATISDVPTNLENGTGTNSIKLANSGSATGNYSVSLNGSSSGTSSVAEGAASASGDYSHAEGGGATASGQYSHAEGLWTTAASECQHVFGKYNVTDSNDTYVEIVGNGIDSNNQSNAYTLDWSGNGVYAGKVTVGSGPTANMDVATKQYVDTLTENNIMSAYFTSNYTLPATSTYYKLPINSSVSVGTKLTLDTTNHNIVIGSGVSKVKISAKVCYNTLASSGDKWLTVYRNTDSISANPRNLSGRDLIYATTFLVNVQENDIIYFSVFGTKNDVIRADIAYSNLTVEVVE